MSFKRLKYKYTSHKAACPICGVANNKLLYQVSAADAAAQFLATQPQINTPDNFILTTQCIESIWKTSEAAIVRCSNCRFVFADPFKSGTADFYNLIEHSVTSSDVEQPINWKWEFDITYKVIHKIAAEQSGLKMLEIGASNGDFSKRVSETLLNREDILCLEYSINAVSTIKKRGIEAHTWDFRELKNKPEFADRFDIVCLFQVLEHLDELDTTFQTFNSIVKPGGHLFIGVPNDKKIQFNELNGGLLDLPPNHIGRYTPQTFKLLAARYGWIVKDIQVEQYTPLDVMKTVMFSQSLKRAQYPPIERTFWYTVKEYTYIKYLRLKSLLFHKQLGEALWIHYEKPV